MAPARLSLSTVSSPARPIMSPTQPHTPSRSPFRYVHIVERIPASPRRATPPPSPSPPPSPTRLKGLRISTILRRLKPWLPIFIWGLSSLFFIVTIAFFKTELFTVLDELSNWLRVDEHFGYAVIFLLIFITTFPPIPLYSTLIVLSGYTFGAIQGFLLSYFAALTGALTVFLLSRTFLRDTISRWLATTPTLKRAVTAIERRPTLLFLIRLAPYPYNAMNALLAAAPTLSLRTYTLCTAASLPKLLIHASVGASISHSFRNYSTGEASPTTRIVTIVGVVLCVALFIYIAYVARKAVNDELADTEAEGSTEERATFLSHPDTESDAENGVARQMVELRR